MRNRAAVPIEAAAPFGAFTGALVIAVVSGHSHRWIPATAAVGLLCAFVLVWSLWTTAAGALFAVICAALSADGFIANRYGTLTWTGRADGEWLCVLIAAALVGRLIRAARARTTRAPGVRFLDHDRHRSPIS